MASQSGRRAPRNMTRRERRTGGARTYRTPTVQTAAPQRRSYMAEPTPVDYTAEYGYVRHDLLRILIWATVLIALIVLLAVLNIPEYFARLIG